MSLTDYDDEDEDLEEEEQQEPKGGIKGNVKGASNLDPDAFADALVSRLESRKTSSSDADRDEVLETINYLRGEGYSDDYIKAQILSLNAQEKKLERKLQKVLEEQNSKRARETSVAEAKAHINVELKQFFKEVPEMKEFSAEIRAGIDKALEKDTTFWAKFNRGEVDVDTLSDVVDKVSGKFLKLSGGERREKSINSALKPAAPGGNAKAKASMKEKEVEVNEEELESYQLAPYYSFLSTNMRRLGMSEEEAKKDAFATARKLPEYRAKKSVLD